MPKISIDCWQKPKLNANDWVVAKKGGQYIAVTLDPALKVLGMAIPCQIDEEEYKQRVREGAYVLIEVGSSSKRAPTYINMEKTISEKELIPIRLDYNKFDRENPTQLELYVKAAYGENSGKREDVGNEHTFNSTINELEEPQIYGLSKETREFIGRIKNGKGKINQIEYRLVLGMTKVRRKKANLKLDIKMKYYEGNVWGEPNFSGIGEVGIELDDSKLTTLKDILAEVCKLTEYISTSTNGGLLAIYVYTGNDLGVNVRANVHLDRLKVEEMVDLEERGYKVGIESVTKEYEHEIIR